MDENERKFEVSVAGLRFGRGGFNERAGRMQVKECGTSDNRNFVRFEEQELRYERKD